MFTGIIEEIGAIKEINCATKNSLISIETKSILVDAHLGDSISVNGVCLTISKMSETVFSADVSLETIEKTTMHTLRRGDNVNLERALKAGDRFGGHIVTGHIDGIGFVEKIDTVNGLFFYIKVPDSLLRYMVFKGSAAIDGISLTIANVYENDKMFSVAVIPLTAKHTTISRLKKGDMVNIECDIIGKYIEKMVNSSILNNKKNGLTKDFLTMHGFGN